MEVTTVMKDFPHCYAVDAEGATGGDVEMTAAGLPAMPVASPAEFGGPGDRWSPETLLTGAIADCFILTFRAVATASKLQWTHVRVRVSGTLDKIERVTRFTSFEVHATLDVPSGVDLALAIRAMEKAERNCLISSSLNATVHLVPALTVAGKPASLAAV
jgi:organic hydroperoxide reductase OsmC/OhrA